MQGNAIMSKAKLVAARDLIKNKKYNEARSILGDVDDPTARKWLAELDRIAPARPVSRENSSAEGTIAGVSSTVILATISIMLFVTFFIAIYGAFLRPSTSVEAQANQQWEYLVLNADLGFSTDYQVLTYGQSSQEAETALEAAFESAEGDWIVLPIYLNALGDEGWVLVDTVAIWDEYAGYVNYIFRRPR